MKPIIFIAAFAFAMLPVAANAVSIFTGSMTGSQEVPPNASPGTGPVQLTLSDDQNSLTIDLSFLGLTGGNVTAAHLHCCAGPGVNSPVAIGFPGFPAATSGTYNTIFDLTLAATFNSTFVTNNGGTAAGARAALIAALFAGGTYVNLHNQTFPGGEIRADLAPVPLPAAIWLFGLGLAGLGGARAQRLLQSRRAFESV